MKRFINPYTLMLLAVMVFMSVRNNVYASPMEWVMSKVYILPGIVIGLAFHEFAHAWVANKLGDDTPRLQGRVTLNPVSHIDPIGMIALIFVGFGWGVPVEINPRNFKKPRRDELLVSLAGVTMNLILAILFTVILKIYITAVGTAVGGMYSTINDIIFYVIYINLVLMVFNLLPIPPLDGFNILTEIFNLKKYDWWYAIYDKGFIILMIFIVFGFTSRILTPTIKFLWGILSQILWI
ncbi:MAG: site-2 protease family protein [Anaerovoracaceae bacterium]